MGKENTVAGEMAINILKIPDKICQFLAELASHPNVHQNFALNLLTQTGLGVSQI